MPDTVITTDANEQLIFGLTDYGLPADATLTGFSLADPQTGSLTERADGTLLFTPNTLDFTDLQKGFEQDVAVNITYLEGGVSVNTVLTIGVLGIDHPPVGVADTANVAAGHSVTIDVLANDKDPDLADVGSFGIASFTQPVDENHQPAGSLQPVPGPDGHPVLIYTAPDGDFDTGTHTVTFTYVTQDQWFEDSQPTTVTITVTGNAVAGETVCGGNHPQEITGTAGNDNICGGNQEDTLTGAGGADTLSGENGKDSLVGGEGFDSITGDNGDDTINGGPGDDTLSGGAGHDRFIFEFHFGHDVITDWDKDSIQVSPVEWGSFQDLYAHAQQVGTSVVITSDDHHDTLTLLNTTLKTLAGSAGYFSFI